MPSTFCISITSSPLKIIISQSMTYIVGKEHIAAAILQRIIFLSLLGILYLFLIRLIFALTIVVDAILGNKVVKITIGLENISGNIIFVVSGPLSEVSSMSKIVSTITPIVKLTINRVVNFCCPSL